MASIITIAGEKLFAAKAQANEQLDIDTFIFANVPGQDPAAPINREEGIPTEHKVHEQIVQQVGRINENVVVYSTVLDSVTGPFDFNWVGLYSSVNNTLVAINHIPTTPKTITEPGAAGNTLNRNFGIEYSGIADLTGITVAPETWQLDFTARLGGMDRLTQQLAADMNGKDWFIQDGFKVVPRATVNTFSIKPGVGYVSGLRIEQKQEHILTLQTYPQFVYVDAWFSGTANSVWTPQVAFTVTNAEMDDYIDVNGVQHYVFKLAVVNTAYDVEDLRNTEGLAEKIKLHATPKSIDHDAAYSRNFITVDEMKNFIWADELIGNLVKTEKFNSPIIQYWKVVKKIEPNEFGVSINGGLFAKWIPLIGTSVLESDPKSFGAFANAEIGENIENKGHDDSAAIALCIDFVARALSDINPGKVVQTVGNVILSGLYGFSEIDIPTGVVVTGDPTSAGFVDLGEATERAAIEVGGNVEENAFCGLVKCLIKGNKTEQRILVRYNKCIRKCVCNYNQIYNGWRNLDTVGSWALEFNSNYIWGAVESCAVVDNGTASNWNSNRLEIAGEAVFVIDGSQSEPINIVLNNGSIQFGDKEGVKALDVVSFESRGVFYEGNNKLGGYDFISIRKGAAKRVADYVSISGGFFTPGGGEGGRAVYADAKVVLVETEIRGNKFSHGVVVSSNTKYAEIKGAMPGVANPLSGYNSDNCVTRVCLESGSCYESGVLQQKQIRRNRTVSSNTIAQSLDYEVTCTTTSNSVSYTLRDEDFIDGRIIYLSKSDIGNVSSITVVAPLGKSVVGKASKDESMAQIKIKILGNNAFCY